MPDFKPESCLLDNRELHQSGLQAFRLLVCTPGPVMKTEFQSLNRAYKRSDTHCRRGKRTPQNVSIPQSGLQAFRRHYTPELPVLSTCFNPSIGLTSVPT